MADNSHKISYHTGEAKGQVQEKVSNMMDKASDVAQSTKESVQEAGQQMMAKAQGVADAVKDTVNK
ncbi:stress-induced protein KIN2-like [Benincasa hispida]|uniref:stress-induced protein KIN2-like n=1 Tax=Benincasa hispida TaxID=102211 RepID=UPI0018FFF3ED|nr:stress-induced protein KIN2-like [Benincasa hispida]